MKTGKLLEKATSICKRHVVMNNELLMRERGAKGFGSIS